MDWESYSRIMNDICLRSNSDWEEMDNNDRVVVKSFVMEVLKDLSDYAQKIEQWENYYGKLEDSINLQ